MPVKGGYLLLTGSGAILLWSGLKGKSWSSVLRNLVAGKDPTTAAASNTINTNFGGGAIGSATAGLSSVPGGGGNPSANKALAKLMVITSHPSWATGQQWSDWVSLWDRESGWSNTADTRSTGAGGDNAGSAVFAYGVAQARPYSKMPKAAWPPDKGGSSNAGAQISWGIDYIAATYGSPSAAKQHEDAQGWY